MERKIVQIDESKCNGCGLCANACHEGAIKIVDGVAKLIKDDYCDGLGDCLPHCPQDAIKIVLKDVNAYDHKAVQERIIKGDILTDYKPMPNANINWPCQIKLLPTQCSFFNKAHLLIAADCTAFAYSNFHHDFMQGRICMIGCSKLDNVDYTQKFEQIFKDNDIRSITILRMEVPCCSGLEMMVKKALVNSKKDIHISTRIVSISGEIIKCY